VKTALASSILIFGLSAWGNLGMADSGDLAGVPGFFLGYPQVVSASYSIMQELNETDDATSSTSTLRGLSIEAGLGGGKVGLMYGWLAVGEGAAGAFARSFIYRSWKQRTYIGLEFQLIAIFFSVKIGPMIKISGDSGSRFLIGASVGIGI